MCEVVVPRPRAGQRAGETYHAVAAWMKHNHVAGIRATRSFPLALSVLCTSPLSLLYMYPSGRRLGGRCATEGMHAPLPLEAQ